jgi:hypothetical protein
MDVTGTAWRISSYSGDNGGTCVEVGSFGPAVAIRDSTPRRPPAGLRPRHLEDLHRTGKGGRSGIALMPAAEADGVEVAHPLHTLCPSRCRSGLWPFV